jgi:hypothetical protein
MSPQHMYVLHGGQESSSDIFLPISLSTR